MFIYHDGRYYYWFTLTRTWQPAVLIGNELIPIAVAYF